MQIYLLSQKYLLSEVPHYGSLFWGHFLFDTSGPLIGRKYSVKFLGEQVFT